VVLFLKKKKLLIQKPKKREQKDIFTSVILMKKGRLLPNWKQGLLRKKLKRLKEKLFR